MGYLKVELWFFRFFEALWNSVGGAGALGVLGSVVKGFSREFTALGLGHRGIVQIYSMALSKLFCTTCAMPRSGCPEMGCNRHRGILQK